MSLLAGFDVAVELSRRTLRDLALRYFPLADTVGRPPPYELRTGREEPRGHFIIRALDLELLAGERVALLITFDDGSLTAGGQSVCPLAGSLRILVDVQLRPGPSGTTLLGLSFEHADVETTFDAASLKVLERVAGAWPLQRVDDYLTQVLREYGFQSLGVPLQVKPGLDGSLGAGSLSSTRFERVEVRCMPDPDRERQSLVLLGTLLAANHAKGDPAQKGLSALAPGQDVALSLSDEAFRRFVFCEGLRQGLQFQLGLKPGGLAMSQVPGPCGGNDLQVNGVWLTHADASLAEGFIRVSGAANKNGTCYNANASFDGDVSLWLSGNSLGATVLRLHTETTTKVHFFCGLLKFLGAIFTASLTGVADSVGLALAGIFASDVSGSLGGAAASIVGQPFALTSLGTLQGVRFQALSIAPEALTLAGVLPMSFLAPAQPSLNETASVTRRTVVSAGTGLFHVPTGCTQGDYPYEELLQEQVGQFFLLPTLFGDVFITEWWVDAGSGGVKVPRGKGTLTLPLVKTHYPLPLTGGSEVVQDVHLSYDFTREDRLELRNVPGEGCFAVTARARCQDCSGARLKGEAWVSFDGDVVDLDDAYAARVQACYLDRVRDYVHVLPDYKVPPIVPVNYPRPEVLLGLLRDVARLGLQDEEELLRELMTAHGTSLTRALLSPPALRAPAPLAAVPTRRNR